MEDKIAWADKADGMHMILRTRGACAPQARHIARVCMGARRTALGCVLLHRAHDAWHLAVMRGPAWLHGFSAENLQRMVLAVRGH